MTALDVERLRFTFGAQWSCVTKWDDDSAYRQGIAKLQGELDERDESTKAVDVEAFASHELYLFEAKDFRPVRVADTPPVPNAIAYQGRWKTLPLEVALKARDTLAGLVGLVETKPSHPLARAMTARTGPIRVVALVPQERRPAECETKRKVREKEMRDGLLRRLSWVTHHVTVIDPLAGTSGVLPDVTVTNLPATTTRGRRRIR